jgi:hypothetical protein
MDPFFTCLGPAKEMTKKPKAKKWSRKKGKQVQQLTKKGFEISPLPKPWFQALCTSKFLT